MVPTQKQSIKNIYRDLNLESRDRSRATFILALALKRLEDFVLVLDRLNPFHNSINSVNS